MTRMQDVGMFAIAHHQEDEVPHPWVQKVQLQLMAKLTWP
jgi:hypothetical protein